MATISSSSSARMRADSATPACCSEGTVLSETGYYQHVITSIVPVLSVLTSSSLAANILMTWFPMNWWRRTFRQTVERNRRWIKFKSLRFTLFEICFTSMLRHNGHTTTKKSIIPGSVWWSQEQQSTSHHACISSALDPLWRMEQYHYHSKNLLRQKCF